MKTTQMCLTMEEDTVQAARSMPGNMSASKVFRHFVKAWKYDDKQWSKYRQTEEGKAVLEFLRPLRDRLTGK